MSKPNDRALSAFVANMEEIRSQLSRFTGCVDNHMDVLPEDIHWGHVGDTVRVIELLDQINSFLNVE